MMIFRRNKTNINNSENLKKQLDAITDVSSAIIGKLDLDEVLTIVIKKIARTLGAFMSIIYLWDEKKQKLFVKKVDMPEAIQKFVEKYAGLNIDAIGYSIDDKENIFIQSIIQKKLLSTSQVYDMATPVLDRRVSNLLQKLVRLKRGLSIPLIINNQAIGILAVSWRDTKIDDNQKEIVNTFANQISIAIYNARLFSQVQTQVEQLNAKSQDLQSLFEMSKVAIKKIQSDNTVQEVLDIVPQQFAHLGYVGAGFFTYDEKKKQIRVDSMTSGELFENLTNFSLNGQAASGFSIEKYPDSIFAQSLLTEDFVRFDDFSQLNPDTKQRRKIKKLQKELGIQSGMMRKIFLRGLIPGVLMIATKRTKEEIGERDERIMHSLVNNFSLAYENAQLYKKTVNQLNELRKANEELKRLDEAKTNFVSIASHQLRTPVSGIRGYLSMLYEGDFGKLKDKQKEIVELNLANLERLNKLIDTFLDVTKIEAGKLVLDKEPCDLSEVISSILKEFDHQVSVKGLKLVFTQPKNKSHVMCDPERIRHAIANLIDNAIKYTPEGSIEVLLNVTPKKEIITVRDTGVGLKPHEAEHLFEKFVRASGGSRINANGSGLGLYIVKKVVEGHDGKVWVESDGDGKGTAFHIELKKTSLKEVNKKKTKK